ncbi:hypothetical protein AGOR_G00013560 [Albula goreensis]|uniref:Chemokine interleukin-8-like domain-containing protein n=1 Tax=Albula goreensis TaxID=1534307 RepID=A0A8T3EC86_9TELE|nr:hypothetical protein AGOR_G00013560 [Albula goreensis]
MSTPFRAAVLLLLVSAFCSYASANIEEAVDCCLSTSKTHIPLHVVKTYAIQTTASGCRIPATLFITKKNLRLCAPPAKRSKWVTKLIKRFERRSKSRQKKGKKN